MIFAALLFPELGKGEDWERRVDGEVVRTFFPFEEYETLLLNWAVSYELNQNRFRAPLLARISAGGPGTHKFNRLLELITCNYSYLVFQYIAGAKADLSTCETSLLDIPELDLSIPFSRQQLSTILAPLLSQLAALVRQVVQEAGLEIGEIDIVLGTGGSSLITCVRDLLEGLFRAGCWSMTHLPAWPLASPSPAITDMSSGISRGASSFVAPEEGSPCPTEGRVPGELGQLNRLPKSPGIFLAVRQRLTSG